MKKIRHTFKTILILALIVSLMLPTCVVSESATQRTQAEALAWIKARGDEAWWDDVDNAYGCQCVDLIMAYYSYLGVSRVGGNACDYITNKLPDGWYRDHTPTPGSIFVCPGNVWNGVWTDTTGFGHVGLVYSVSGNTKKTVETNTSGDGVKGLSNAKWKDRNFDDSVVWYIHPFNDNANYIDVNIKIDGVPYDSGFDGITFDVYINGTKKNNNISDFCACYEIGTTYRIDDIQYDNSKYYYSGSSSYTGTVGTERSNIFLSFVSGTCKTKNAKKPTCTATGYTGDYGFEEKGGTFHVITKGTTISALGHDYQLKNYECKCETVSGEYVCSRCGSTKNEKDKEYIYSNWTTTKPTGVSGLETKTGYRFGTKEIKYSENSSMSGYTPTGKTVTDFTNAKWSAWKLGTMAATNTRKVETKPLYRYYAWICPNCGNQDPLSYHTASGDCTNCGGGGLYWGEVWSPIPYSESSYTAFSGTNKSYSTSLGDGKRWYFTTADVNKTAVGSIDSASDAIIIDNGYRYCDGVLKYEFYRGVNFSNWQDTSITETDSTVVETKTIYRYKIMPTGHTVGEWEITENANCTTTGTKVKKCSVCHEVVETQTISKTDHTLGEWEVSIQATCTSIGKEVRRCTECKNVIEERDIEMKAHEYEETIVPATPTEQGYTLHSCKHCTDVFKDNYVDYVEEPNPPLGVHQLTHHSAKAPTESSDGNIEYWKCDVCGKCFSDSEGKNEIEESDTVISKDLPHLLIEGATTRAGKTVELYVSIKNNPGIISLRNKIVYDTEALELESVEDTGLLKSFTTPAPTITSPYTLRWADSLALANNNANGKIIKLVFKVKDETAVGKYEISAIFVESYTFLGEKVQFSSATTFIEVVDYVVGDADGDGEVSDWDAILLQRYLAGWNVDIELVALDFDGDGEVSDWDAILFERYLAGWNIEIG